MSWKLTWRKSFTYGFCGLSVVRWVFFKDVAWTCEFRVSDLLCCLGMFCFKIPRMLTLWPVWTWVFILQIENEVSSFFLLWSMDSSSLKAISAKNSFALLCPLHFTSDWSWISLFSISWASGCFITASQTNISFLRVVKIKFCSNYESLTWWPLDPCSTVMISCFWFAEVEFADRFTTSRLWFLLWRKDIKVSVWHLGSRGWNLSKLYKMTIVMNEHCWWTVFTSSQLLIICFTCNVIKSIASIFFLLMMSWISMKQVRILKLPETNFIVLLQNIYVFLVYHYHAKSLWLQFGSERTAERKRESSEIDAGSKRSRHSVLLGYKCLCLVEMFLPVAWTSFNCFPTKLMKMLSLLFDKGRKILWWTRLNV